MRPRCESCNPAARYVYEAGQRMVLLQSTNVFAAGLALTGTGLVISFAPERGVRGIYLFPHATAEDLVRLDVDRSPGTVVRELELRDGLGNEIPTDLRSVFEETWGLCGECDALVETVQWAVRDGEYYEETDADYCPECASLTSEVCIDRCMECGTYSCERC